jgi:hypothetical protein
MRSSSKRSGQVVVSALLLGSTLLVGGCAFRTHATGLAVDYNDFVAETTNKQTVLNILRAREREPMHFTSFSEVFGQIRGQGSASLSGAFNGDSRVRTATDTTGTNAGPTGAVTGSVATATRTLTDNLNPTNYTPNLGVQVTTGTDFKVAANATDEFYRGILNPVAPTTVIHYLRQGFPSDLLSHLLVGRLEFNAIITKPDNSRQVVPLLTINNSPDEEAAAAAFTAAIRCRSLDYSIERTDPRRLPIQDLTSLSPISTDTVRRIFPSDSTSRGSAAYELEVPANTSFTLLLSEPDLEECETTRTQLAQSMAAWIARQSPSITPRPRDATEASVNPDVRALKGDARTSAEEEVQTSERSLLAGPGEVRFGSEQYFDRQLPEGWRGDLSIDLTLRSVQGVLYYLGEYVRVENGPLLQGECGYCLPVIRVLPARELPQGARFVDVSYRGARYGVPLSGASLTPVGGRSSQTIDIVQQLLNLNRRASDLPTTPLVRVAN